MWRSRSAEIPTLLTYVSKRIRNSPLGGTQLDQVVNAVQNPKAVTIFNCILPSFLLLCFCPYSST